MTKYENLSLQRRFIFFCLGILLSLWSNEEKKVCNFFSVLKNYFSDFFSWIGGLFLKCRPFRLVFYHYFEYNIQKQNIKEYYRVFHRFWQWWFNFKLEPIFTSAPAASKNEAHFKNGQNQLKIIGSLTTI